VIQSLLNPRQEVHKIRRFDSGIVCFVARPLMGLSNTATLNSDW
jgi:hypothetical protein